MNSTFVLRNALCVLTRALSVFIFILLGYTDYALGETTAASKPKANTQQTDDKSGMIKGMAAGFGGFIGFLVLICVFWCCCCGNDDSSSKCCCKKEKPSDKTCPPGRKLGVDRSKIGPSPPQSAASWSRSQ